MQILDSCINPQWPFVPIRDGEDEEKAWSRIEDKPLQYHFHYRLLDGDQASEPARTEGAPNDEFDHLQPSCLQLLCNSVHSNVCCCYCQLFCQKFIQILLESTFFIHQCIVHITLLY